MGAEYQRVKAVNIQLGWRQRTLRSLGDACGAFTAAPAVQA